jgi:quercetin dioxygenase-like cupin family protein
VQRWTLSEVETPDGARSPVVLHSEDGVDRVVLIRLSPGQQLGDHGMKEAALLLLVDGCARIETGEASFDARAGDLFHFDPDERRSVRSEEGASILLTLVPWPGVGHYRGLEVDAVA